MVALLVVGGLIGLLAGGELLVSQAAALARHLRVSPLVIGLTVVGFGTSAPELVTCVLAALAGAPDLAVGNVVGSNIANVLLVVGLAVLARPAALSRADFRRDAFVLGLATLAGIGLCLLGQVGRLAGCALVFGLVTYLVVIHMGERAQRADECAQAEHPAEHASIGRVLAGLTVGLALTVAGARWLVQGAIAVAVQLQASETMIGLTLVAIGTSLPELVTSVIAARRGHQDVAFGNVVGSNVFNLLGILGVTALVEPMRIPSEVVTVDVWVMSGATVWLIVAGLSHRRIGRLEGGVLLATYVTYVSYLVLDVG